MTYDRDTDVLYISARQTFAARGVEDSHGVVWRYNPAEDLIGVTVVDFLDQRFAKQPKLAKEISSRFGGPEMQTSVTNTPQRSFGLIMIVLFDPWSRPPSID